MEGGLLFNHLQQILTRYLTTHISTLKDILCKITLLFVKSLYLLLNSTGRQEVINGYSIMLSHTVSTVGCLLLYGRIPPRIKVEDIVGACKVES